VSCASAGNCGAAGAYETSSKRFEAFVVVQKNGRWGKPIATARSLNVGGNASTNSVSCPAVGNCGAGEYYKNGTGKLEAFVVNEVNGTWHMAIEIPHIGALNAGGNSSVNSIPALRQTAAAPAGSTSTALATRRRSSSPNGSHGAGRLRWLLGRCERREGIRKGTGAVTALPRARHLGP
jgi:hypothetical protein